MKVFFKKMFLKNTEYCSAQFLHLAVVWSLGTGKKPEGGGGG